MTSFSSVIHQADKHLRTLVNKKMLALKQSGLSKEEMNESSKNIYSVKTELLEDFKTGFQRLDKDIVESVGKRGSDSSLRLHQALDFLFQNKLKL